MVTQMELFESPDRTPLDILCVCVCVCGWINSDVYNRKVDTPEEFRTRTSDAAACIKKREDQLRRTTCDLRTRVAKCCEVDGGIFERVL